MLSTRYTGSRVINSLRLVLMLHEWIVVWSILVRSRFRFESIARRLQSRDERFFRKAFLSERFGVGTKSTKKIMFSRIFFHQMSIMNRGTQLSFNDYDHLLQLKYVVDSTHVFVYRCRWRTSNFTEMCHCGKLFGKTISSISFVFFNSTNELVCRR